MRPVEVVRLKGPVIRSKAGQYTWLQVLALAISIVAYIAGSMVVAIAMLVLGTVFGVLATYLRVREARRMTQNSRGRRRG